MLEAIWQHKSLLQWSLLVAFIGLAYLRGASPERQVASVFVGIFAFDRMYHWAFGKGVIFLSANLGHILIDAAALAAFVLIALRANRMYPLWLASFQLMTIVSHIVRAANPTILNRAYAIFAYVPSYLEVMVFGIGVLLHYRRQAMYGPYRSWLGS